ncbi:response regulator [Flavihumibacter petaseus]|uniref:Putative two-component response regulator n=1 Tax=Flavihumibacter petaseus NBRC 106054 TaxID=1220578 RepID=A0A0E9N6D4_9BACT|nr:response regulator transcription factor [Flavihumibacter petaseus]GAO44900.1 putative two-component response regulator [Flavihumibacter petaseus NBRC 106054]
MHYPIRLLVADDHPLLRDGFHFLLKHAPNIELVGEAANGQELIDLARQWQPDVIITDIQMPGVDGIEATRVLHTEDPAVKIIAFSLFLEEHLIIQMLEAGAKGYVQKQVSKEELIIAIQTVAAGGNYFCAQTSRQLTSLIARSECYLQRPKTMPVFSAREKDIIALMCEGLSNKEIGEQLHLSSRTVETYRERLFDKMEVKNATALAVYAIRHGLYNP